MVWFVSGLASSYIRIGCSFGNPKHLRLDSHKAVYICWASSNLMLCLTRYV